MKKIVIANRGEIAIRIIKTARRMGIATALVYAAQDSDAAYLKEADEAILLEGSTLNETYLNIAAIIAAAKIIGADAIHPGYGFLSENKNFATACEAAGIIFIGPSADAMQAMGNKIAARAVAMKIGVPVTQGVVGSVDELLKNYHTLSFPILIKAAAGGGGKGMRIVQKEAELKEALEATAREAQNYFGDNTVYIEKYIENPRHIEVQILGDSHGNIIHLFERECSLQRRHQKIIEEAPSPTLSPAVREKIGAAAVQLANAIQYTSAGTIEFLVGPNLEFYFLEMNTRIQVEHPVTELTTGIDIVEQQIRIARGEVMNIMQNQVSQNGHAIECRIYAEDPAHHFMPAPGMITYYKEPAGENIRIDGMQLATGALISGDFDAMISKLIVWGSNREAAREKMLTALQSYFIYGIKTNIGFLQGLLQDVNFIENTISTKYIDHHLDTIIENTNAIQSSANPTTPLAAALVFSFQSQKSQFPSIWESIGYWRYVPAIELTLNNQVYTVAIKELTPGSVSFEYNNHHYQSRLKQITGNEYSLILDDEILPVSVVELNAGHYKVRVNGLDFSVIRNDIGCITDETIATVNSSSADSGSITAPMPGKIIKVAVKETDTVKKGDLLLIVEAMKMENNILSPFDATVAKLVATEGNKVDTSAILVTLKPIKKEL